VHEWLIVFKARSSARFKRPADRLELSMPSIEASLSVRTRFTNDGLTEQVPRELMFVGRGVDEDFDHATNVLGTYASAVANIVAFATNAAVPRVELFVGVEATPGLEERELHQQYGELENGFPHQGRAIDINAAGALTSVMLADGEDRQHIAVAVHHYSVALTRWELGTDVFALNHLYTAAEALEKAIAVQEARQRRIPVAGLHEALGVPKNAVGAYLRRTSIFAGAEDVLARAKAISDGFEHGSLAISEAQEGAKEVAGQLFVRIRESIIDRSGISDSARDVLMSDRYRHPLDPTLRRIVDGTLIGAVDEIAAPGYDYPFLEWQSTISELAFDERDELQAKIVDNLKINIPDGAQFRPIGSRVFGRPRNPDAPEQPRRMDATVSLDRHVDDSGSE
jgi:hypothetical protein